MIIVDINLSREFANEVNKLITKNEIDEEGYVVKTVNHLGNCNDKRIKNWIESDTIFITRDKDFKDYDNAIILEGERVSTLIKQLRRKLRRKE